MTKLLVKVSDKNKSFVLYNHLFARENKIFTIDEIHQELIDLYSLDVDMSWLRYEIEDYLNCGLVMHHFNKYEIHMK